MHPNLELKQNRMTQRTFLCHILLLSSLLTFTACNGMFGGIYDTVEYEEEKVDTTEQIMHVVNLDVTDYASWIYLDLHTKQFTDTITLPTTLEGEWDGKSGITYNHGLGDAMTLIKEVHTDAQPDAEHWDLAIHHFDVKTNGCGVLETNYTSLDQLPESSAEFATAQFTPDEWTTNQALYDLSGMLNYDIGYQNTYINKVLSRWVTMDFSTPPPVYSMSGKVYVIRLKDGTFAALKLENYMNKMGLKGYLTFDIIYPY